MAKSKSKQSKQSGGSKSPGSKSASKPVQAQRPGTAEGEHPKGALADEDFVYVPRGKSRGMYIFILALMVFTLIMFVVPYGLSSLFDPRAGAEQAMMTWEHPRLGTRTVEARDFMTQKRALRDYYALYGQPAEGQFGEGLYDDRGTAAFFVSEALADEAGVEYGADDLSEVLRQSFSGRSTDEYKRVLASRNMTIASFEAMATRVLRVDRFKGLIAAAAALPSPNEVAEDWSERHQQYRFDAVGLSVEPLLATARSEATDEAELKAWYESRPPRSGAFAEDWREATAAVELVAWPAADEPPAGLLERYPLDAGEAGDGDEGTAIDPAELARQYYDGNYHTRFALAEPTTDADGNPKAFLTFEEAEEAALREAPVHRALGLWRDELATRLADGEPVDVGAEAAALGLFFAPAGALRPLTEWTGDAAAGAAESDDGEDTSSGPALPELPYTGRFVADGIRRADAATGLAPRVVVEADALLVTRKTDGAEAGPAPFEEVRDKVVEEWAKERAGEIAVERLQEAYDALAAAAGELEEGARPVADLAAFEGQAAAMGASVVERDWFDPSARLTPGTEEGSLEATTRRAALRMRPDEGELTPPEMDPEGEQAWMLRCAGRRDPPELDIEPGEYATMLRTQQFMRQAEPAHPMTYAALQRTHGLRLLFDDDSEESGSEPQ